MHPALLDQALDPGALLEKLDDIEQQRSQHPEHAQVPAGTYQQIRDALTNQAFLQATPSASTVRVPQDFSRPPATIFLHSHAALSQFQSVIANCFQSQLEEAGKLEPSQHGFRRLWAEIEDRFRRYGPCDIRWIEPALHDLATRLTEGKYPFPDRRPATVAMADRARLFIVGDWATGLHQALNVARSIKTQVDETPADVECHVIHLGDTYYSGEDEEYDRRFLDFWPVQPGSRAKSWSLNGNHDMYAGGHGFFEVLLRDSRFEAQGGSSYFCLGNRHWQIVGLDSSYKDPDKADLAGSQAEWLQGLLAADPRPGTILLTHHQPFSAWEAVGTPLAGAVTGAIGDRQIEAWLWGHEHRCAVYKPGIQYGAFNNHAVYTAIIGHGGVPNLVSGPAVPPEPDALSHDYLEWESTDYYTVAEDTWSYGGYAVMDLTGDSGTIQYFTEVGQPRTEQHGAPKPPDELPRVK